VRDRDGGVVGLLSATDLSRSLEVTPLRRRGSGRSRAAALIAAAAAMLVVVVAAAVYHPPVVVLAPGPSFDVREDIEVSGVPVQRPTGPYLLTSVQVSRPSALGLLVEAFRAHRELLPLSAVLPAGLSAQDVARFERRAFTDSQQAAAVAAATEAGYPASLSGAGARVLAVVPYSSAAGVLEAGDTVVAAEGTQVDTAADLARVVAARPAGQEVTLTVRRGGDLLRREVSTEPPGELAYGSGLGALVVTADLEADLPFAVRFRDRPRVGGPSAGLVYALALGDMLDPGDTAAGRAVAASGTVSAGGRVGPVGGIDEKGVAAAEAGADLLLVPRQEVSSVAGVPLDVVGVGSLDQALTVLGRP
jgi:PDZ domain-containing protein